MKTYSATFFFLLVNVVSGVDAQELLKASDHANSRPLNLSMRKPVAPAVDSAALLLGNETATEGPTSPGSDEADHPAGKRYGSGYESRQQGASAGERGSGGGSDGKSGSGGEGSKGGKGGSDGGGGKGGSDGGGGKGGGKGGDSGHGS
jgi:uncharacterized membrane protein YgcG